MPKEERKEQLLGREEAGLASSQCTASATWAHCQVGDVFSFGRYPQGANGEVRPIEWLVLRRDEDGLLVLAKYALDLKLYNDEWCAITWSQCTLRKWLNGEFIDCAFDATERQHIKEVLVKNPNSKFDASVPGGPDTHDKVFLLSHDEAESLFANAWQRECQETEYAKKGYDTSYKGMCWWWLRSPGCDKVYAAHVSCYGYIDGGYNYYGIFSVRPAMKLAL